MVVRYSSSFAVAWLQTMFKAGYVRYLQIETFGAALEIRVAYYDTQRSDEIMNAIVIRAETVSIAVSSVVRLVQESALCLMYLISLYIAPSMTLIAAVFSRCPTAPHAIRRGVGGRHR